MRSVSVIISTYTRERLPDVMRCISSLKNQTSQPAEVILVLEPSYKLLEFYRSHIPSFVKIVVSGGKGLSKARNAGVKNAVSEIVAFIDDDAIADKKWLESSITNYGDPQVMGVGGNILAKWEHKRPIWFPEELDWIVGCSYKGLPRERSAIRNPIGCNMSFRKAAFNEVGYFRADIGRFGDMLLCNEETEFSIRVLSKIQNSKIIYEPSAIVCHRVNKGRENVKYVWVRSFYEGLSKAMISHESIPSVQLSTEVNYLKYLLSVAIPSRCRRIYKFEELSKLLTLMLSLFAVFTGFVTGKIVRRV